RSPPRGCIMSRAGLASFTLSVCPSTTEPFSEEMAAWAASADSISTKPKPRERPVVGSVINSADTRVPNGVKRSSSSGKQRRGGRLPTKSRTLKLNLQSGQKEKASERAGGSQKLFPREDRYQLIKGDSRKNASGPLPSRCTHGFLWTPAV